MNNKRITIGRTLNHSPLKENNSDDAYTAVFVLNSGRKATFRLEVVPAEEVEEKHTSGKKLMAVIRLHLHLNHYETLPGR